MKIRRKRRRSNVWVSFATGNRNNVRGHRFLKEIGCSGGGTGNWDLKFKTHWLTKTFVQKRFWNKHPIPVTGPIRKFAKQGSPYCVLARLSATVWSRPAVIGNTFTIPSCKTEFDLVVEGNWFYYLFVIIMLFLLINIKLYILFINIDVRTVPVCVVLGDFQIAGPYICGKNQY